MFTGIITGVGRIVAVHRLGGSLDHGSRLTIETPLMWIDKAATWEMAQALGGDAFLKLIREDTHTCYLGERGTLHDWGYGCSTCPACELRARGYKQFVAEGKS